MKRTTPSAEYDLIAAITANTSLNVPSAYSIGLGDDAAVRRSNRDESVIITTDSCVEGTHFTFENMSAREVGFRGMVTNLSDCAAMGATPDSAFVNVIFPRGSRDNIRIVTDMYKGLGRATRRWGCPVMGGDLSGGPCYILTITVLGTIARGRRALSRKGILPGDILWGTGCPGQSAAGLDLIQTLGRESATHTFPSLVKAHVAPVPHIKEGKILAANSAVHACMDLSDGLSKDAATLCTENRLDLFLAPPPNAAIRRLGKAALMLEKPWESWYYHGGEDYNLIFAASPRFSPADCALKALRLGTFKKGTGRVFIENTGWAQSLDRKAWDHLR